VKKLVLASSNPGKLRELEARDPQRERSVSEGLAFESQEAALGIGSTAALEQARERAAVRGVAAKDVQRSAHGRANVARWFFRYSAQPIWLVTANESSGAA